MDIINGMIDHFGALLVIGSTLLSVVCGVVVVAYLIHDIQRERYLRRMNRQYRVWRYDQDSSDG